MIDSRYDLVIVGGGIAGGALATVLARAGRSVLVLEKSDIYRDLVRGEWIAPWGVAEASRLGLLETLMHAGGHYVAGINVIVQGRLMTDAQMAERFLQPMQEAAMELGGLLLP